MPPIPKGLITEDIENLLEEYEDRGQASTVSDYASVSRKFGDYPMDDHGPKTLLFDEIDIPLRATCEANSRSAIERRNEYANEQLVKMEEMNWHREARQLSYSPTLGRLLHAGQGMVGFRAQRRAWPCGCLHSGAVPEDLSTEMRWMSGGRSTSDCTVKGCSRNDPVGGEPASEPSLRSNSESGIPYPEPVSGFGSSTMNRVPRGSRSVTSIRPP